MNKNSRLVTLFLIGSIWLAFALTVLVSQQFLWFSAEILVYLGANYGPLTVNGQWWRLISSVFLHAGLLHILFNSIILFQVGSFIEVLLPRWFYIMIFLTTGLLASTASLVVNYGVISIGASGAIFGLFGYFAALLTTKIFPPAFKKKFIKNIGIFILLNLMIGMIGPIDNAAHVGGLISGFIIGLISIPFMKPVIVKRLQQIP